MQDNSNSKQIRELLKKLPERELKQIYRLVKAYASDDKDRISRAEYNISTHFLVSVDRLKDSDKVKFKESIKFHTERKKRLKKDDSR